jgi:hypothetical protein
VRKLRKAAELFCMGRKEIYVPFLFLGEWYICAIRDRKKKIISGVNL